MKKNNFLLTNDDGIMAPGILELFKSLQDIGQITIAAPSSEKSSSGLAITTIHPLMFKKIPWDKNIAAWSISGTPADCVKLALSVILDKPPDLILSGINRGSNSGRNVLYSGTVGCVIEGALRHVPGIAFSSENFQTPRYSDYSSYIQKIVNHFMVHPLPEGTFINVTFPSNFEGEPKGIKMATQGKGLWAENPDKRTHPEGHPYCWLGGQWKHFKEEDNSDVELLKQGYVTIVPMHIPDMTHKELYNYHSKILEKDPTFSKSSSSF